MEKIYINYSGNLDEIAKIISAVEGKNLIFSLIQENRKLEEYYGIIDDVIYDNQDYLTEIMTIEDIAIEINDNLDIIPSSYKIKKNSIDFNNVLKDIENLDYNNIFFIFDEKLNIENKPKFQEEKNEEKKHEKKSFFKKLKGLFIYEEL